MRSNYDKCQQGIYLENLFSVPKHEVDVTTHTKIFVKFISLDYKLNVLMNVS